jgi:membrane-bound ClpP family serine protease
MDLAIIIGLIVLGIFFMILEVFLIPGISIAGIGGLACLAGGITFAYTKLGTSGGTWILGISMLALGALLYGFYKSNILRKMALKTEIDGKTEPFRGIEVHVGDIGKTVSRLAPIGRVFINGQAIEGRSENEMIDENTSVIVTEVGSYNVVVKKQTS